MEIGGSFYDRKAYSTCYMCACRCGIEVYVRNNKVTYIKGNDTHPTNKGVLCAKGSSGIMKEYSPARLRKPLLRVGPRGSGQFKEIEWEEAFHIATQWLEEARKKGPHKIAFFTGRDQMQQINSWFAGQLGTVNWAAHGGFCSVNIAAAGLYSIGGSFWEFGEADFENTKYFMLVGVAEDHSSNPFKLGIQEMKRKGGKFVVVNPVRWGYGAVADEWVPIKPGTDGAFFLSIMHVLFKYNLVNWEFLKKYTNASWLVIQAPGTPKDGLFYRNQEGKPMVFDKKSQSFKPADRIVPEDLDPAFIGEFKTPEGYTVRPAFDIFAERLVKDYSPEKVEKITGIPAKDIERIAKEMGTIALYHPIELPIEWTDVWGRKHKKVVGRPVSFHIMRGIASHTNGFQTARTVFLLMMMLGVVDAPGGFLNKPPYPKHIEDLPKPYKITRPDEIKYGEIYPGPHLGYVQNPDDLLVDEKGNPVRIDWAYSWWFPMTAHGLIHNVIPAAYEQNPYGIEVLMIYMANMAWNSSQNIPYIIEAPTATDPAGNYIIPKVITIDAFYSEQVAYSDLVLPDATYLEQWFALSLLDRPPSAVDGPVDALRHPIINPKENGYDVMGWGDVMVELGSRLKLLGFVNPDGSRKYKDFRDFLINWQIRPGVGALAGWRGKNGDKHFVGEPNPRQLDMYIKNKGFFYYKLADNMRYYRHVNKDYQEWAVSVGFLKKVAPMVFNFYLEPLQTFRLAGQGLWEGKNQPPNDPILRERLIKYFDPLPFWYPPFEEEVSGKDYPLYAFTQRPQWMYHSWDSQNAWLRQISTRNYLYMNPKTAEKLGIKHLDWVWVESRIGKVKCQVFLTNTTEPNSVWTWNAIGKMKGAWGLKPEAEEGHQGFLLNHVIPHSINIGGREIYYGDPITGHLAWFDTKVKVYKAEDQTPETYPQFEIEPLDYIKERWVEVLRYKP